jgi:ATP-dependent RNA helicase RhlE
MSQNNAPKRGRGNNSRGRRGAALSVDVRPELRATTGKGGYFMTRGGDQQDGENRRNGRGNGGNRRGNRGASHTSGNRNAAPRSRNGQRGKKNNRPTFDISKLVRKAIQTTETVAFEPKHKFEDFKIHEKLKANIAKRKFVHPTPIQDGAIPYVLDGRDVIGIANTGTGKTAAFLIPLINKVFHRKKEKVLILVPTRELAIQIDEEFRDFSFGSGLRSAVCIGGAHMDRQISDLRRGPSFVIGTPGRTKDLIERGHLDLSGFGNVVLDEVDRMLDMGFVKDIKYLLSLVKEERQSLFFSATMENGAKDLAVKFLQNPVTVAIKSRPTSENVDQDVVHVNSREEKMENLHDILVQPQCSKVIIFARTKRGAERLGKDLVKRGFRAGAIHGDMSQGQRQRSLQGFRDGRLSILVATDVAARGLDIDGVTHVINYDMPASYEDYIHRIGRTGRGSNSGHALTFVEHYEK